MSLQNLQIVDSPPLLYELRHLVIYKLKKPQAQLEAGKLIISIDVDAGSNELGIINRGRNDTNVHMSFDEHSLGMIEERALPFFIDLFRIFEVPVTFGIRGQLTETDHSVLDDLVNSSVKHDIGAHGYYHRAFGKLSHEEAENELDMISAGMKRRFGISPKSFIFPKNSVAHLDLLEKFQYKCYRGVADFLNDCMYIEKHGQLCDVHPSLYINRWTSPTLLIQILNVAIAKKAPFHIWFHLWNFGLNKETIQKGIRRVFFPVLNYAKKKSRCGALDFDTMLSAAEKNVTKYGH